MMLWALYIVLALYALKNYGVRFALSEISKNHFVESRYLLHYLYLAGLGGAAMWVWKLDLFTRPLMERTEHSPPQYHHWRSLYQILTRQTRRCVLLCFGHLVAYVWEVVLLFQIYSFSSKHLTAIISDSATNLYCPLYIPNGFTVATGLYLVSNRN